MSTTWIKDVDWAVVWCERMKAQIYRRSIDVVFSGDTLTHVGPDFSGTADEVVEGSGLMVMPGLVDIHSHPQHEPSYRGLREEHGVPNMYMTGLFERSQAFGATDDAFREASFEVAACELLTLGRYLTLRHRRHLAWLGRSLCEERDPRLPRARLRLGTLEARK